MPSSTREEKLAAFGRLLDIMDDLREKCPWDREQTMESLRQLTIEETYELADAIIDNDLDEIRKELGDILLHMVFYSKIGDEKGAFDVTDVLHGICDKLVHRHPHIYGDTKADDAATVLQNWEKIKLKEGTKKSVLDGVPRSLPAMVKATRIQEKVRGVGFDWDDAAPVWAKVFEELEELRQEVERDPSSESVEQELGDAFFALINYARFIGATPENALERTNKKFIKRFKWMEEQVRLDGKSVSELQLADWDVYWEQSKQQD